MSKEHRLLGQIVEDVSNIADSWEVLEQAIGFENNYLKVTEDSIKDPNGDVHSRVVVRPRGAVGVAAIDEENRILLVQQFRHAVQQQMIEIPAGILDVEGESKLDAAARELAEEAEVVGSQWNHLLTMNTTPGFCSEQIDIFLARGLSVVADDQLIEREAEEAFMKHWWVPIDEAIRAVLAGKITDAKTMAAILAVPHS